MKITRIHALADGKSCFEDMEIALADQGKFGFMSELQEAPGIIFREIAEDYDSGWHVVPGRLYLVILRGTIEITPGLGQPRLFGPGSAILAEDIDGTGHRTKAIGHERVQSILVQLTSQAGK